MNRLEAFLSGKLPHIFHPIQHRQEIWKRDPFDVETVHAQAREAFERLIDQAIGDERLPYGRILLLRGDAGCGKTHLARAFRNYAHGRDRGFVGYLQMTTTVADYPRYLLSNLLESLDLPYDEGREDLNALMKLSAILANRANGETMAQISGAEDLSPAELSSLIRRAADDIVQQAGLQDLELDLVRAVLYLQRDDARIKQRVLKYLRCEVLPPSDSVELGGLPSRTAPDAPQRVIEFLGKLMGQARCSLVLCVDQLEDTFNFQEGELPFRRMISTLSDLTDRVPSSIVVLCCLEQYWSALRAKLAGAMIDRIENDPPPITLETSRSDDEIRAIVGRRLAHLYEELEVEEGSAETTEPFPEDFLHSLRQLRTRDVLEQCGRFRAESVRTGRPQGLLERQERAPVPLPPKPTVQLDQLWNDFRAQAQVHVPEEDAALTSLLLFGIERWTRELPEGARAAVRPSKSGVELDVNGAIEREQLLIALCNKSPKGNGLAKQLEDVADAAAKRTPVLLRSTAFPDNAKLKVAQKLGDLIARRGARRATVEPSEWRALMTFREFVKLHEKDSGFDAWVRNERPVSRLPAFAQTLRFEAVAKPASLPPPAPSVEAAPPKVDAKAPKAERAAAAVAPSGAFDGILRVGTSEGLVRKPVAIELASLKQHAVFLGGSGSGKTTLAMNLVEQVVQSGVPAILLDRKGDLANYAGTEAWAGKDASAEQRAKLRERVDVALFTPGDPRGRPLAIGLLPELLSQLDPLEQAQALRHAAEGLSAMLGYRDTGKDRQLRAILLQGLKLLSQTLDRPSLQNLIDVVGDQDAALIASVGRLDKRLFKKLAEDLETFRITRAERLFDLGELLDVDLLLGRGRHAIAGKTRLSIVSTRFLGDADAVQFWVTQLLTLLSRWTSRAPSRDLQALLLVDEADIYLPAGRKPPTKEPMESLLKRARSAGLGILLATQSPGDLDYRCRDQVRTWFLGRVKEPTALAKLKPMLSDFNADVVEAKLPKQGAGQFHLVTEKGPRPVLADRSLITPDQLPEDRLLTLATQTRPV